MRKGATTAKCPRCSHRPYLCQWGRCAGLHSLLVSPECEMTPTAPLVKRAIESVRAIVEKCETNGFVWERFDVVELRALLDEYDRLAVTPGAPDRGDKL